MFDVLIKGGTIVDGTGNIWLQKDIGISEGKIKRLGFLPENGRKTINAEGKIVSPGFIDSHTHTDLTILARPNAECHLMQGVTTVVVGSCGHSLAPIINSDNLRLLKGYLAPLLISDFDYEWDWETLKEYYEKVEEQGISLNVAPLAGQGAIRLAVKGFDSSEASKEEMAEMKKLLQQDLEDGAFGLSTGLIYPPGSFCTTEELIELASVLKKYGVPYITHLRNEGHKLLESLDEAIKIGEENGIAVEISHHKAAGKANWGKVNASLRAMEQARQRGVEINCDVYPYTAGSTIVNALLPIWVLEGGVEKMLIRLKNKKTREAINREITDATLKGENMIGGSGWNGIFIGECPPRKEYEGKSLEEIMKGKNTFDEPCAGFLDLFLEIEGNATVVVFQMHEEDVKTVMASPLSLIGSDSWATAPSAGGKPHPRAYGTFPRVLGKYVREERTLTLENALRKMTSLPAGKFGLENRGIIKEGFWADVVIFDAAKIKDKATYADPHQYPEGINYVIVNGQIVVENGRLTDARPGKVLKKV